LSNVRLRIEILFSHGRSEQRFITIKQTFFTVGLSLLISKALLSFLSIISFLYYRGSSSFTLPSNAVESVDSIRSFVIGAAVIPTKTTGT